MERVDVSQLHPFKPRDQTIHEFSVAQREAISGKQIKMPPGLNPLQKISFVGRITQELKNNITEEQFKQFRELSRQRKNISLKQVPKSEYDSKCNALIAQLREHAREQARFLLFEQI